jgi:hypothetical protein
VQRLTVYTHLPEDRELFAACSAHFIAGHPPPDPAAWAAIEDPGARLRSALADLHRWYEGGEAMFGNVERDAAALPELREVVVDGRRELDAAIRAVLSAGLRARHPERLRAAIGLADGLRRVAGARAARAPAGRRSRRAPRARRRGGGLARAGVRQ